MKKRPKVIRKWLIEGFFSEETITKIAEVMIFKLIVNFKAGDT